MTRFVKPNAFNITVTVLLTLFAGFPRAALGESPVKLHHWHGAIDLTAEGVTPFFLEGTASHLGRFTCHGEVVFVPGEVEGSLVGQGVAVFTAANGDLLVGNLTWDVAPGGDFRTSRLHFSWSDSVELSDQSVVSSTGRFVKSRPEGLVVISIIGILVGLLLPA